MATSTLDEYISNGAFIQAVIDCGLKYKIDEPNAFFAFQATDFYDGLVKTKMQLFVSKINQEQLQLMTNMIVNANNTHDGKDVLKVSFDTLFNTLQMFLHNNQDFTQYDVLAVLRDNQIPVQFKFYADGLHGLDIGKSEVALNRKIIQNYLYR